MAPNSAASQRNLICDMIISKSLTAREMADVAGCSIRSVKYIRSNLRCFGTPKRHEMAADALDPPPLQCSKPFANTFSKSPANTSMRW
jgi:DNA-binding CsgD family transcriptional regulator